MRWSVSARYHGPAIFVTITPEDFNSVLISFYAGRINAERISEIALDDFPSLTDRIELAAKKCVFFFLVFQEGIEFIY